MRRQTKLRPNQGGKFWSPVTGLTPLRAPVSTINASHRFVCALCGRDVLNDRAFAICRHCDELYSIRKEWALLHQLMDETNRHDERECFCPGWLWMNEEDDRSFNIERCDSCDRLACDQDAFECMTRACCVKTG